VCDVVEVGGFFVHAVDDCGGPAEFSGFKADADALLFFFYFSTNTEVFGKPACWTNFSHESRVYGWLRVYIRVKNWCGVFLFGCCCDWVAAHNFFVGFVGFVGFLV